jgi:hypothetical protein
MIDTRNSFDSREHAKEHVEPVVGVVEPIVAKPCADHAHWCLVSSTPALRIWSALGSPTDSEAAMVMASISFESGARFGVSGPSVSGEKFVACRGLVWSTQDCVMLMGLVWGPRIEDSVL